MSPGVFAVPQGLFKPRVQPFQRTQDEPLKTKLLLDFEKPMPNNTPLNL